ncbi:MAG: FISUMP domain-containing protein [Ignavibacteriaceae bacterium]|nr:FISUMP domain-containing protein [Ignavibacteriaceae bacterium]
MHPVINKFFIISICLLVLSSCKKENNPIVAESPSVPNLISPINNSTGVHVSPVLSWSSSSGATSYNLIVSSDSGFTTIITTQSKINDTSYQVSSLNNSTTYYWKVSATNSNGNSDWSFTWKFTTGLAPTAPTLISPENNFTPAFMPVTFSWSPVTAATSYTLQLSTDISFNNIEYNLDSISTTSQKIAILKPITQYFWRVSANNIYGSSSWQVPVWNFYTASGSNTGITCPGLPTITFSNRIYNTVQIGNQCWLKENLDVGTMINANNTQTDNGIVEKFCYNNDSTNCKKYGGLYQWTEAMQYGGSGTNVQGICPTGWRLPDTNDFNILTSTLNNNAEALKAISQGSGSGAGTDASGFSALLAGYRGANAGAFGDLGGYTNFWSSMESNAANAYIMWIGAVETSINQNNTNKIVGFSVRCIKD